MQYSISGIRIAIGGLDHPEGVAVRWDGKLFAGGEAGRVYRNLADGKKVETIASRGEFRLGFTLGRPEGLHLTGRETSTRPRMLLTASTGSRRPVACCFSARTEKTCFFANPKTALSAAPASTNCLWQPWGGGHIFMLDLRIKGQLLLCHRLHMRGKVGEPEDVAHGVVFLASDLASFATGSAVIVGGALLVSAGGMAFQQSGTGATGR